MLAFKKRFMSILAHIYLKWRNILSKYVISQYLTYENIDINPCTVLFQCEISPKAFKEYMHRIQCGKCYNKLYIYGINHIIMRQYNLSI